MSSSMVGFTGRYANALFELADEKNSVDAVAKDLSSLAEMIEGSDDLERLVTSPAISKEDQSRAMQSILEKSGADPLVKQFVGVIASNGRLFALTAIIDRFLADLATRRGDISAEVCRP